MKKRIVTVLVVLAAALLLPSFVYAADWTGWITDDHCGAKGASADHKACAERCLARGGKLVFFNNADKKLYGLDNQELAKANLGHEVKVTGEATGTSIKVESIAPVK